MRLDPHGPNLVRPWMTAESDVAMANPSDRPQAILRHDPVADTEVLDCDITPVRADARAGRETGGVAGKHQSP